jgi:hypothetical protein
VLYAAFQVICMQKSFSALERSYNYFKSLAANQPFPYFMLYFSKPPHLEFAYHEFYHQTSIIFYNELTLIYIFTQDEFNSFKEAYHFFVDAKILGFSISNDHKIYSFSDGSKVVIMLFNPFTDYFGEEFLCHSKVYYYPEKYNSFLHEYDPLFIDIVASHDKIGEPFKHNFIDFSVKYCGRPKIDIFNDINEYSYYHIFENFKLSDVICQAYQSYAIANCRLIEK